MYKKNLQNKKVGQIKFWRVNLEQIELKYTLPVVVKIPFVGFPGGAVVENLPANAGDTGSSPGLGRSHMPWSN